MSPRAEIPAKRIAASKKVPRSSASAGPTPKKASSTPPAMAPAAMAVLSMMPLRPLAAGSSEAGTSRGIRAETATGEIAPSRPLQPSAT